MDPQLIFHDVHNWFSELEQVLLIPGSPEFFSLEMAEWRVILPALYDRRTKWGDWKDSKFLPHHDQWGRLSLTLTPSSSGCGHHRVGSLKARFRGGGMFSLWLWVIGLLGWSLVWQLWSKKSYFSLLQIRKLKCRHWGDLSKVKEVTKG